MDKIHLLNESCDNVTDIDTEYDHFECEVSKVIDKHVPIKHRYPPTKTRSHEQRTKKTNLQQTNAKK